MFQRCLLIWLVLMAPISIGLVVTFAYPQAIEPISQMHPRLNQAWDLFSRMSDVVPYRSRFDAVNEALPTMATAGYRSDVLSGDNRIGGIDIFPRFAAQFALAPRLLSTTGDHPYLLVNDHPEIPEVVVKPKPPFERVDSGPVGGPALYQFVVDAP